MVSNFGETHLKIVSHSEEILNLLDIKANPKRVTLNQGDEAEGRTQHREFRKNFSKPELYEPFKQGSAEKATNDCHVAVQQDHDEGPVNAAVRQSRLRCAVGQ
jgi:hypothetical protein